MKGIVFKEKKCVADYVTAVYDLEANPITFDFAYFLAAAELFALKKKKGKFTVLIIPPRDDRIVDKIYRSAVDEENIKWRFENIILPLMNIYPECIGHSIILKRSDIYEAINGKLLYPEFYSEHYLATDFLKEVYV